jgi:hypothetical protein
MIQHKEARPAEREDVDEQPVWWSSPYVEISANFFEESSVELSRPRRCPCWKIRKIWQRPSKPERGSVLAYILPDSAIFTPFFRRFFRKSIAELCDKYSSVVSFIVSNYLNLIQIAQLTVSLYTVNLHITCILQKPPSVSPHLFRRHCSTYPQSLQCL